MTQLTKIPNTTIYIDIVGYYRIPKKVILNILESFCKRIFNNPARVASIIFTRPFLMWPGSFVARGLGRPVMTST